MGYSFPGNIRELENAIERAFVLAEGQWLKKKSLPPQVLAQVQLDSSQVPGLEQNANQEELPHKDQLNQPEITINSEELDFQKNKEEFEKKFIIEALKRNKGRLNQTALQANIPKKTLQRKLQKYGIDLEDFK